MMRRLGLLVASWSRFRREARMVWAMLRDPAAPLAAKLVAVLALAYVVSPVDFVSDLVPILGWLDDALVLAALLALAYRLLPGDLYEALRRRTSAPTNEPTKEPIDGEARRVG